MDTGFVEIFNWIKLRGIVWIFFFLALTYAKPPGTLRLVQTVFRHGARSPTGTYPNDPYQKHASRLWPRGWGELTKVGMMQQYQLGQYLRQRYDGFLPKLYNENHLYVRSTDYDRTIMSAQCQLAGLYPPQATDVWNPNIPWQPIPVHVVPQQQDYLLKSILPCPKYESVYEELLQSPFIKDIERKSKELFASVAEHSGDESVDLYNLNVFFILTAQRLQNLTLPSWVTDNVFEKMKELNLFSLKLKAYNTPLKRLSGGGSLVKDLLGHWKEHINGSSPERKMFMYSAHDVTLATLLLTLNIFNDVSPPYAASVIFELHEVQPKEYHVQVLYKNDSNHEPYKLTLPGCSFSCSIEKFIDLTKDVIPIDYNQECQLYTPSSSIGVLQGTVYGPIACFGILLLILQVVSIFIVKKRRKDKDSTEYVEYARC